MVGCVKKDVMDFTADAEQHIMEIDVSILITAEHGHVKMEPDASTRCQSMGKLTHVNAQIYLSGAIVNTKICVKEIPV